MNISHFIQPHFKNGRNFNIFKRILHQSMYYSTASSKKVDLSGIFPPVPTPFTNKNGRICYDNLKKNFEKWNTDSFKGYVVQGSNGEYVYLSFEERLELFKRAKECIPSGRLLLAGAGCESTKETILMCSKMGDIGADAVLIVTPNYYKSGMKDAALCNHYEQVADESPVPVILYNVPTNTGVDMSVEVIKTLCSHDNIIGIKESGGDITKIASILHVTDREDFQVLAGSAGFLLAALNIGCVGGVCALADVLGSEVCQLYKYFIKNEQDKAIKLQKHLVAPNTAVTKLFGVPGLKHMMSLKGFYGGPSRSPLQELTKEECKKIEEIFRIANYL